jgi:hypothetical protein
LAFWGRFALKAQNYATNAKTRLRAVFGLSSAMLFFIITGQRRRAKFYRRPCRPGNSSKKAARGGTAIFTLYANFGQN